MKIKEMHTDNTQTKYVPLDYHEKYKVRSLSQWHGASCVAEWGDGP
jgi:hypothetical protein